MSKNKGKCGKNRRGKNEKDGLRKELVFKENGQEYVQATKMLGNGKLEAICFDGVKRLCHIREKFREKVKIKTEDTVLMGLGDYQDAKADVIKYSADEARNIQSYREFLNSGLINETINFVGGDLYDDIKLDDRDSDVSDNDSELTSMESKPTS